MSIPFFKNCGPLTEAYVCDILEIKGSNNNNEIRDIKDLYTAEENDVTFFHSTKYINFAKNTKASFCITSNNLKDYLPKNCKPLIVKNVLVSMSKITSKFYPS